MVLTTNNDDRPMPRATKTPRFDAEDMRRTLQLVQAGDISVSRAVEVLDMWVAGRYADDLLPPRADCLPGLNDDHIIASFESAGIEFQRFVDARGREVHWTAGSQDASRLIDGVRTVLAAHEQATALL